jgi:hypothetical protein
MTDNAGRQIHIPLAEELKVAAVHTANVEIKLELYVKTPSLSNIPGL